MTLPLWQCHKKVQADKITECDYATFQIKTENGSTIQERPDYFAKHKPKVGGYYVIYVEDPENYTSWSPAPVFLAGYTQIQS